VSALAAAALAAGSARGDAGALALRRAALWALLASKVLAGMGVQWDIQWHVIVGRDTFWIPPHVMTYAGVTGAVLLSFGVLACETLRAWRTGPAPGTLRILGLVGTRGYHLATWGIALTVLAAPIDDLWHRLFGIDVTLWSPPHLLGLLGAGVNTLGCLLVATEVYPLRSLARAAATVASGALLYGIVHLTIDPAGRLAFLYGGLWFCVLPILGALMLPLALVPTARLSALRWAPVLLLVLDIAVGVVGQQVARTGIEVMQPVSVIEAEIAADPTSPIAVAQRMARADSRPPGRVGGLMHLIGLPAAVALALVDPRRRPLAAALAYATVFFPSLILGMSARPSLAPMLPGPAILATGWLLAVIAGTTSGLAARALSRALEPAEPAAR